MKSFGWKQKVGSQLNKNSSKSFEEESKEEDTQETLDKQGIDWLTLTPKIPSIQLEDALAKCERLKNEGSLLASDEKYWQALKKWDEALRFNPNDTSIVEMKAQAFILLCEVVPALKTAEKVVEMEPVWWVAYQTLGRAHLGLGEVRLALRAFSKAVHLNPGEKELWEEDLGWARELLKRKQKIQEQRLQNESEDNYTDEHRKTSMLRIDWREAVSRVNEDDVGDEDSQLAVYESLNTESDNTNTEDLTNEDKSLLKVPQNYVFMRD